MAYNLLLAIFGAMISTTSLFGQTVIHKTAPQACYGCNLFISNKIARSPVFVTNYVKVGKEYENFSNAELAKQVRVDANTLFLRSVSKKVVINNNIDAKHIKIVPGIKAGIGAYINLLNNNIVLTTSPDSNVVCQNVDNKLFLNKVQRTLTWPVLVKAIYNKDSAAKILSNATDLKSVRGYLSNINSIYDIDSTVVFDISIQNYKLFDSTLGVLSVPVIVVYNKNKNNYNIKEIPITDGYWPGRSFYTENNHNISFQCSDTNSNDATLTLDQNFKFEKISIQGPARRSGKYSIEPHNLNDYMYDFTSFIARSINSSKTRNYSHLGTYLKGQGFEEIVISTINPKFPLTQYLLVKCKTDHKIVVWDLRTEKVESYFTLPNYGGKKINGSAGFFNGKLYWVGFDRNIYSLQIFR